AAQASRFFGECERVRNGVSEPVWEGEGLCDCQPSAVDHRNRTAARDDMSMNTSGTAERRDGLTGRDRARLTHRRQPVAALDLSHQTLAGRPETRPFAVRRRRAAALSPPVGVGLTTARRAGAEGGHVPAVGVKSVKAATAYWPAEPAPT
ncbi:hypothetical protein NL54_22325, partial [Pantoea stewartii]